MFLSKLDVFNFKNYTHLELVLNTRFSLFFGRNGSGKTNLLDAVYFVSIGKSNFNHQDRQLIRHDQDHLRLVAAFRSEAEQHELILKMRAGSRKEIHWDGTRTLKLADHLGRIPIVFIAPDDQVLLYGGSEERRRFLDQTISQVDAQYGQHLMEYGKVLGQRNALLKRSEGVSIDKSLLAVYDEQLDRLASAIHPKREACISALQSSFKKFFSRINLKREELGLAYTSHLQSASLSDHLKNTFDRDRILKRTSRGIHKDELELLIDGLPIRRFGSQGQQKSLLIALRLAQHQYLKDHTGKEPLLLLDDICDKLDQDRLSALLECLKEEVDAQVLITNTENQAVFQDLLGSEISYFTIQEGELLDAKMG